jgi:NAD(P)-dependent dehydrogenase (short-subunit alcohol dehydrogenase family)
MTRRAALVTGASRGIGRAIARRLSDEGLDLTITARTQADLDDVAASVRGVDVAAIAGDLAVPDDVDRIVRGHVERFGRLDVLVLNAGTGTIAPIEATSPSRFDKQMAVNFSAPFRLVSLCLPVLRRTAADHPAHGAKVLAVASITGMFAEAGMAVYAASKAALISLCETVNVEASRDGVCATALAPGYVDTDMSEWIRGEIPPDTMLTVDDVAELAVCVTRLSARAVVPTIPIVRAGPSLWRA